MRAGLPSVTALVTVAATLATVPVALAGPAAAPAAATRAERRAVVIAGAPATPGADPTELNLDVNGHTVGFHRDPPPDGGWLGVLLGPADGGVAILAVADGSPAARAGLQAGDVVTSVDGTDVADASAFMDAMKAHDSGDRVRFETTRDGRDRSVRVRLADQPVDVSFELPEGSELPAALAPMPPMPPMPPMAPHDVFRMAPMGRPRLGVQLTELTDQLASYFGVEAGRGVLVQSVVPGTPAERAGLQAGDVIVGVGGDDIAHASDISRALAGVDEGESVTIDVMRKGVATSVDAVIDTPKPAEGETGRLWRVPASPDRIAVLGGNGDHAPIEIDVQKIVADALSGIDADTLKAAGLDQQQIHDILTEVREAGGEPQVVTIVRHGDDEPQVTVAPASAGGNVMVFRSEDGTAQVVEPGEGFSWTSADGSTPHVLSVSATSDGAAPHVAVFRSDDGSEHVLAPGEGGQWTAAADGPCVKALDAPCVKVLAAPGCADGAQVKVLRLGPGAEGDAAAWHAALLGNAWVL